jgi:hypothetical protein
VDENAAKLGEINAAISIMKEASKAMIFFKVFPPILLSL